jgi:ABC-type multidrug transport system ATPase subunit
LTFAARFKLPSNTSSAEINKRVDGVLEDFGLTRVAGTLIGNAILRGVSGGEKRRVTLAAQLITFPPIG